MPRNGGSITGRPRGRRAAACRFICNDYKRKENDDGTKSKINNGHQDRIWAG